MKRIIGLLTLVCTLTATVLQAQETQTQTPSAPQNPPTTPTAVTPQTTGEATVEAAAIATNNDWQNWVFAGCALAVVIAGVVIVSFNKGHTLNDH